MQREDFRWFVEHYDDLFREYGDTILAIHNKRVIGTYQTVKSAIDEVSEKIPLGEFIVQRCNGEANAYTNYIASTGFITI